MDVGKFQKKLQIALLCFIIALIAVCLAMRLKPDVQRIIGAFAVQDDMPKVIVDAGHGAPDGGASTPDGVLEKDLNLAVSLRLRDFFAFGGYKVIMTREGDEAIYDEGSRTIRNKKLTDLHNRLKILNENPDVPVISIHMNVFPQRQYYGTHVFYSPNNPKSKVLADTMQEGIAALLQPENNRVAKKVGRDVFLLYNAKQPAVLVECGFLSNPREAALLCNPEYQGMMAYAIFASFLEGEGKLEKMTDDGV